jgi:hypothetical protein
MSYKSLSPLIVLSCHELVCAGVNHSHHTESIQLWNKLLFGVVNPTSRLHAARFVGPPLAGHLQRLLAGSLPPTEGVVLT